MKQTTISCKADSGSADQEISRL